jgi:2-polyprenyl-3-methyl-5-hydroxy-6-metoxy-1,4-benzoquinol methylase
MRGPSSNNSDDAAGWTNVSFHHGAIQDLGLDSDFDAVVGRWVLMYVPDPVELLGQASGHLRPGGIVRSRRATSFLTQSGAVTPAEVDIDTLEDRLRADVVARQAVQILPPLIGAWARNVTR